MIDVNGRGLRSGRVSLTPLSGAAVLRVDDDDRPEFWVEVVIPLDELRRIVAAVEDRPSNEGLPDSLFQVLKIPR